MRFYYTKCIIILIITSSYFSSCNVDAKKELTIKKGKKYCSETNNNYVLKNNTNIDISANLRILYTVNKKVYDSTLNISIGSNNEMDIGCYREFAPKVRDAKYVFNKEVNFFITCLTLLIGAFLTGIASFLGIKYSARGKRNHLGKKELFLLIRELEDIKRHSITSLLTIYRIREKRTKNPQFIPLTWHIKKMKYYEYILLFNADTFKLLPNDLTPPLVRIRLAIRNHNIEIEEFVKSINEKDIEYEKQAMYVTQKFAYLFEKVYKEVILLLNHMISTQNIFFRILLKYVIRKSSESNEINKNTLKYFLYEKIRYFLYNKSEIFRFLNDNSYLIAIQSNKSKNRIDNSEIKNQLIKNIKKMLDNNEHCDEAERNNIYDLLLDKFEERRNILREILP